MTSAVIIINVYSLVAFVLVSCQPAIAVQLDAPRPQRLLIAQVSGVDQGVCYKCGRMLINGKCPVHNPEESSSGSSSGRSGGSSGGSADEGNGPLIDQTLPTPFQLQKQQLRNRANSMNESGIDQLNHQDPDGAIESFEQALAVYPDFDAERQKIVDNLALARSIVSQRGTVSSANPSNNETLAKAKRLVSKLVGDDGTAETKLAPLDLNAPTAPGTRTKEEPPATRLPEPEEWVEMGKDLLAVVLDPGFSALDQRVINQEYKVLNLQFQSSWMPLDAAYHRYVVAQDERERLRIIIEQHNLHKPAPGAPVQEWNDEMRMLLYETEQCEKNISSSKAAFEQAKTKYQPAIEQFLKSPRFISFKQQVAALKRRAR